MVTDKRLQKGLNTAGMKKEDMIKIVEEMRDFKCKTRVEELILSKSHRAMFIPKFHCEFNPIECVWCHAKQYMQSYCDYSYNNLEKIIETTLDSVSTELIRKNL